MRSGRIIILSSLIATTVFGQGAIAPHRKAGNPTPRKSRVREAPAEEEVISKEVTFYSNRVWRSGRWYVVGSLRKPGEILWVTGERSKIRWSSVNCPLKQLNSTAGLDIKVSSADRSSEVEILRAKSWIAIEADPALITEDLRVLVMNKDGDQLCEGMVTLRYGWESNSGVPPLLFVSQQNNRYYGFDFSVESEDVEERADIQLDLGFGFAQADFPNAIVGANKSLKMAPIAMARGEWLFPYWRNIGGALSLSQTVANFGGIQDQNALYSDWAAEVFYQGMMAISDGLQLRASMGYHQHLGDDNSDVPTIAAPNKNAQFLTFGLLANLYFAKKWFTGLHIDYGMKGAMSGSGAKQGLMEGIFSLGRRVSSTMFLIGGLQYRAYTAEGYDAETLKSLTMGIRLEL